MLGKRLRGCRGKRTQEEIAKNLGISRARYSHYENQHVQPDNDMLQKMADLYDVSVDYLLGRTDNPQKEEVRTTINKKGVEDLVEYLKNDPMLDGKPMPQELINDILGYIQVQKAMGKLD